MKTQNVLSGSQRAGTSWQTVPDPAAGFTLIELMITVAIVAILTAIAYPSYRNYVIRGQVVNATNGLSQMSANMERWFQDNRTYVGGPCTTTNYGSPPTYFAVSCPATLSNSPGAPFTGLTLSATNFQLQAVGYGNVAGFNYFIDQAGNQATMIVSPAPSAWIVAGGCPATWETKAGQC